jgi:DNA-binding NarL/FixJ family response regulator
MINYLLLALGIFTILISIILIFLDKLKGEDIYFNIDVKEQEMKKVIEDAEEIIAELNYTSEMVVKDIEEKMDSLKEEFRKVSSLSAAVQDPAVSRAGKKKADDSSASRQRKKKIIKDVPETEENNEEKLNSKQQAVFDYATQGMSVTDIAKKMNIGQGEVMLILSLKNEVD